MAQEEEGGREAFRILLKAPPQVGCLPRLFLLLLLLQVDQRVFKDLMNEKLPRLHTHFEQHRVDFSLITFNWFLIVFVDSVVSDVLFKIWDSFLYEGPKVGP